ncbi:MAG: amidohydrolase family protein [Bryobacteraceae bacterium]|nr:amidohydrolase family protein [Bryobacteraceae bacterium]
MTRRKWMAGLAGGLPLLAQDKGCPLAVKDYQPQSTLHVPETNVPRACFPVIDSHVHLSTVVGRLMPSSDVPEKEGPDGPKAFSTSDPKDVLALMERRNVRMMVNVTGGYGPALNEVIDRWHKPYPGRFLVCVEPWWTRANEPGYAKFQAAETEKAARAGARGLKILKTLGLYLRENLTTGPLVKVDDPRFDPMWEAAGAHRLPVLIHVSDPESFFDPVDERNERYTALLRRPEWSFHGRDFPSDAELQAARDRVMARHPRTEFLILHFGNSANLGYMAEVLDRYPNATLEFGARLEEIGRQPRVTQRFFDRYQDRILFGTDAIIDMPEKVAGADRLYPTYFRFLETDDDYIPLSGVYWRIYGIKLPETILRKVYYQNAERLFRVS